jgi:hypothetical protein
MGDLFKKRFGAPSPATENGLHFAEYGPRFSWEMSHEEIGSGWFLDRFLYLFGDGVDRLAACLDA